MYRNDNAGLTHVRGGVSPDNNGEPGKTAGSSFFSAYRMFDKDVLPFEGQLRLYWRNGGPKCSLPSEGDGAPEPAARSVHPINGDEVQRKGPTGKVTSYVWYYTWDV